MQDHVVSLELSKQLKEVGIEQSSSFYWHTNKHGHPPFLRTTSDNTDLVTDLETYSAFLADEILEKLPKGVAIVKEDNQYLISYTWDKEPVLDEDFGRTEVAHSLADAAACMYLYLKKENLL